MSQTDGADWTDAEILERARALAAVYCEEAAASEEARQPTEAAVAALHDSGLLRLLMPRTLGGLERDLDAYMRVALVLGEADASLAWVSNFLIEHVWWLTQFPESFQKEVFAHGPPTAVGIIAPTGRLTPAPGGYRVDGRWSWASGASCSDWLLVAAIGDEAAAGAAALYVVALPMREVEREDTWFVDGMCGTASGDVVARDRFVPSDRVIPLPGLLDARGPGAAIHPGPLYRTPALPILVTALCGTALGQARSALARFVEASATKVRGAGPPEREKPTTQIRVGRLSLEIRKAELLLGDVVEDVMARRNDAERGDHARWLAAMTEVCHASRRVVLEISRVAGASAHFRSDPLQRTVRDVNTLAAHMALDEEGGLEGLGRVLLGLEPRSPFF